MRLASPALVLIATFPASAVTLIGAFLLVPSASANPGHYRSLALPLASRPLSGRGRWTTRGALTTAALGVICR
jgi:hypothetical protein